MQQLCERKSTRAVLAPRPGRARNVMFDQGPVWADWADAGKIPVVVGDLLSAEQGRG